MMLKFRAWDTVEQKMVRVTRLNYEYPSGLTVNGSNIVGFVESVMLYTGAKDMHKTDICEGDIVRKECAPAFGHYGSIGTVEYNRDVMGFIINSKDAGFYDNMGVNFSFDEIEVIGNIYENRGLL